MNSFINPAVEAGLITAINDAMDFSLYPCGIRSLHTLFASGGSGSAVLHLPHIGFLSAKIA